MNPPPTPPIRLARLGTASPGVLLLPPLAILSKSERSAGNGSRASAHAVRFIKSCRRPRPACLGAAPPPEADRPLPRGHVSGGQGSIVSVVGKVTHPQTPTPPRFKTRARLPPEGVRQRRETSRRRTIVSGRPGRPTGRPLPAAVRSRRVPICIFSPTRGRRAAGVRAIRTKSKHKSRPGPIFRVIQHSKLLSKICDEMCAPVNATRPSASHTSRCLLVPFSVRGVGWGKSPNPTAGLFSSSRYDMSRDRCGSQTHLTLLTAPVPRTYNQRHYSIADHSPKIKPIIRSSNSLLSM